MIVLLQKNSARTYLRRSKYSVIYVFIYISEIYVAIYNVYLISGS